MAERVAALQPSDVSVIVPVYNGGSAFVRCLDALASLAPRPGEIIVVDDGSTDDSRMRAQQAGVRVLQTERAHSGPASARNLAASQAHGQILYFVDADVQVKRDAITQLLAPFSADPSTAAIYGSYDEAPPAHNFISQYKNLFHHFVHQDSSGTATSFWAGCGAIRREVFARLGGFSAAYERPSIEDIELGYRLKKLGYQTRLLKNLQVTHLKQWTLKSLVETDVRDRAVPWTQLILRDREFPADLNLKLSHRLSVALTFLLLASLFAASVLPASVILSALCAIVLLVLNIKLYQFFAARRGWWFTLRAIPLHWFYYFYSGIAFGIGVLLWLMQSRAHGRQTVEQR